MENKEEKKETIATNTMPKLEQNLDEKKGMPSSDDSAIIKFGLSVIFIVFGILGVWSAYAPLATSSVAIGQVSADLNKKTIQHLEGGIVDAIYVKNGDKVKKGDPLLKLKDVQIKAQLNILNSQYNDALALYNRLDAQKNDLDKIVFSNEITNQNVKRNQQNIFETIKKTQNDEKIITQNRVDQLKQQIDGLNSLINSKQKRLDSLKEEIAEWSKLYKQQLVDKQKIRDLQREQNSVEGDIANTLSQIAKIKEQISEVKNQQLLREKEFDADTLQKLVDAKSKVADLKSKIIAAQDTLKRTNIVAVTDGTIIGFEMHTVGGVIAPGKPILEIVPNDAKLIVIARVNPVDIDKVKKGLVADIMFSAFNLKQVHEIQGKVIMVSADSYMDQKSGQPYYEAKIEVTKDGQKVLLENNFVLVAGMPAQVMIKTGDRTALSYFLKPFMQMLKKGFNEE